MKSMLRCLAALAMVIGWQGPASATDYSSFYVFGDSLVDSGNAFYGTSGAEANAINGYYNGRFSNGYNFADYLSNSLINQYTAPALVGGNNLSVGGADAQFKPGQVSPSFLAQIGLFQPLLNRTTIPGDALVLITFGGNDVRDTIGTGGAIDFTGATNDFATGLSLLYGMGARNFLITGSPDIGLLPVSIGATGGDIVRLSELTQRSQQINTLFGSQAGLLANLPGTTVSFFDLFTYEHDLLADPAAYGLPAGLNSTIPCQVPGGGSPQTANCANSLYFDPIHPTTQVHEAIARGLVTQLASPVPEPATWMAMILGFGLAGIALRGRGTRLATA